MAEKAAKTQSPFLMYKGRPLVRSGNTLYYGSMAEKYVIMMQILSTRDENDLTMADKIQIQLMLTDPEVRMKDRIVKKSEKTIKALVFSKCIWYYMCYNKIEFNSFYKIYNTYTMHFFVK